MTSIVPTVEGLRRAVEARDAASLKRLYAADATMTIIDSDNPPSKPRRIDGAAAIGEFLDDVYSRDMTHTIDMGMVDNHHLAFVEGCQYPDGSRVIASNMAELGPKGIVSHIVVQAWDN
jgi:hypothetical protein